MIISLNKNIINSHYKRQVVHSPLYLEHQFWGIFNFVPTLCTLHYLTIILGFLSLYFGCIGLVYAQENKAELNIGTQEEKLQQVEVKAKSNAENSRRDAAARTVVTNAELIRYGDSNIVDAMKRVPGILIVDGQLSLLGMPAKYTQILIDGELPRGSTIGDLSLNMIDRVEIYHVGSAQFGSEAVGGTINIILKKNFATHQNKLNLNISNKYRGGTMVDWLVSEKDAGFTYSLSVKATDSHEPPASQSQNSIKILDLQDNVLQSYLRFDSSKGVKRRLQLNPNIQYKTSNGSNFNWTTSVAAMQTSENTRQKYEFFARSDLPVSDDQMNRQLNFYTMKSKLQANFNIGDASKLDLSFSFYRGEIRYKSNESTFDVDSNPVYKRLSEYQSHPRNFGNSVKITAPTTEEHSLIGGWELSTDGSSANLLQRKMNSKDGSIFLEAQEIDSSVNNFAFFIQDEWSLQKQLSLYYGLRWERMRIQSKQSLQLEAHQTSVLSPTIQVLWQINPDNIDRIRVAMGRAYKAPNGAQISAWKTKSDNNSIENPNTFGNPLLRPELAWTFQTSYEHNDQGGGGYSLRATLRNIKDMHRENLSFFDNSWWNNTINSGHGISKMLQFESQTPMKRFVSNAPNLDLSFSISRNWSRASTLPTPDNILSPITSSVNIGLDYQAKDFPLSLGTNLRYNDHRWQQLNSTTRTFLPEPLAIDGYALWKFSKKTLFRFGINNILKRQENGQIQYVYKNTKAYKGISIPTLRELNFNFEHQF